MKMVCGWLLFLPIIAFGMASSSSYVEAAEVLVRPDNVKKIAIGTAEGQKGQKTYFLSFSYFDGTAIVTGRQGCPTKEECQNLRTEIERVVKERKYLKFEINSDNGIQAIIGFDPVEAAKKIEEAKKNLDAETARKDAEEKARREAAEKAEQEKRAAYDKERLKILERQNVKFSAAVCQGMRSLHDLNFQMAVDSAAKRIAFFNTIIDRVKRRKANASAFYEKYHKLRGNEKTSDISDTEFQAQLKRDFRSFRNSIFSDMAEQLSSVSDKGRVWGELQVVSFADAASTEAERYKSSMTASSAVNDLSLIQICHDHDRWSRNELINEPQLWTRLREVSGRLIVDLVLHGAGPSVGASIDVISGEIIGGEPGRNPRTGEQLLRHPIIAVAGLEFTPSNGELNLNNSWNDLKYHCFGADERQKHEEDILARKRTLQENDGDEFKVLNQDEGTKAQSAQ